MSRSVLRPDQLDSNGSYEFAQLIIDGYSGGDLQDGYLTGLVLKDRASGGVTTLELHADDGEINQVGSGQVTFNGDVQANQNVTIEGDLTVRGVTTSIETDQMVVTDPITVLNASGLESLSDWTAFSARDADGYNRLGWVFDNTITALDDGYWAISVHGEADPTNPDAVPTRALAYLAAGDSYGDLSSTVPGDSGADKIGISPIDGIASTNVQGALEELNPFDANGDYHIGETGECVFFDGYLCSDILPCCDDSYDLGDPTHRFQDGYFVNISATTANVTTVNATTVDTTNVNTENLTTTGDTVLGTGPEDCIIFNGVICSDIVPCCDDAYDIGSPTSSFHDAYFTNITADNEYVENLFVTNINITNLDVDGYTNFNGCVSFPGGICSDLVPCCDDAYDIGDATHSFNNAYLSNVISSTVTTENLTVTGDTVLGTGPEDCIIFNGVICSDIVPCCDDEYSLGDSTHRFSDGYFVNLVADNLVFTNTSIVELEVTGCLTVNQVCSDLIPQTNDAYDVGSSTNRWQDGYFVNLDATTLNVEDVTVTGDITLGTGPEDCIIFNGVICSDIVPCCDDAYDIGSPTSSFHDAYFTNITADNEYVENLFVTNITITNLTVDGYTNFNGDITLGSDEYDCITFAGSICSDIIPCCDDAYQIGDETHRWRDAYFAFPTFSNIIPVGSDYSLIGVLEGIDNALADAQVNHPRGVYYITTPEAAADELDTSRTVDQGDQVDVGAGDITDAVFRDNIYIYWNGQLLWNDPTPATSAATVVNDVARQTGSLSDLVFAGNIKKGAVIQVVDMR